LIASILSVPAIYLAVMTGIDREPLVAEDFKSYLFYTTLGAFAAETHCSTTSAKHLLSGETTIYLATTGSGDSLGPFDTFQYGVVTETELMDCSSYSGFSWDMRCNNPDKSRIESAYKQDCEGKESCELVVSSSDFDFDQSGCSRWNPMNPNNDNLLYFNVFSKDITTKLSGGSEIRQKSIGYLVASFDAVIYIILLLMLYRLKFYENKTVTNVLENNQGVDSYTIQVRSLPKKLSVLQLRAELWKHFDKIANEFEESKGEFLVADVQLAESNTLLKLNAKLETLQAKKEISSRNYYEKWSEKSEKNQITFKDLEKISEEKKEKKKAQKGFNIIKKMREKQASLQGKINKLRGSENSGVTSAFITFKSSATRDLVYNGSQRSPFMRMLNVLGCCASRKDCNKFVFERGNLRVKAYLRVTDANDPADIKWENIGSKPYDRNLRRLISWTITLALWILNFALMVVIKNQQTYLAEQVQSKKDCSQYTDLSKEDAIADLESREGPLECYCRKNMKEAFSYPCSEWSTDSILTSSLPFVIVMIITIINVLLQYLFNFLSSFEKHRSWSSELVSKILKTFVAQALNTGVIILIVNARFTRVAVKAVFEGTYDDVSSEWFFEVAVTILITMIINIINVPMILIVSCAIAKILRWYDRGFKTKMVKKTKKKSQSAWEALYTGPEFLFEFRYSQILTITFISLFYSASIPLVFFSSFLNFLCLYWVDKICLLRLYRRPGNFDKTLHSVVRQSIFLAVSLHLGNAIWNYGNQRIFGAEAVTLSPSSSSKFS